jgi:ribosomal protein L44E
VAAVKAKKADGGKRLATRWLGADCHVCGSSISELKQAWRVKRIEFTPKRRTAMVWEHRACLGK